MAQEDLRATAIGSICWFVNPKISSCDPHPHVCIGKNDDGSGIFFLCGTSQFEKRKYFFQLNGLQFETLVRIQSNSSNTLTRDTYIDCNEAQCHVIEELESNSTFKVRGQVSESELYQIRYGIEISELMEEDLKSSILVRFPEI